MNFRCPDAAAALTLRAPQFHQLVLQFLPEAKAVFLEALKKLGKKSNPPLVLVGRFEDFDRFFDAMMRVKQHANVHNAATALRLMADLAVERLEQLQAGHGEDEAQAGSEAEGAQAEASALQ